jgi:hypothetical protein
MVEIPTLKIVILLLHKTFCTDKQYFVRHFWILLPITVKSLKPYCTSIKYYQLHFKELFNNCVQ